MDSLPVTEAVDDDEFVSPDSIVHIAVAPGILDHEHVVVRSDDDTDEDYAARCRLLAALLAAARRG
jgi:hypothetical protein